MAKPVIIQTTDLETTFQSLKYSDPSKMQKQNFSDSDYSRVPEQNYSPIASAHFDGGMTKFASSGGTIYGQPQFFSPVHTPINWQIPSKRLEIYQWARFFYENEPKVASSIDFYSYFPMNGYENDCKDRAVKKHFDKLKERLDLNKWLRLISHELHLLGDCFTFIEINCEECGGHGKIGDEICEHPGGTIRRLVILNPDHIEVLSTPINPDPVIAMKPDEELINMIQRKTPGFERLSPQVVKLIASGQPIRLDNRNVYHLKYGEGGYSKYGIGMVRRLFPILSYKTKLMVAQWIIAERLILPIKIVKVGSDTRPAGPADIAAIQAQLAQSANDPNLVLIVHHAFEMDYVGASGKTLTLSNEFEFISQEILDGLMINNALLNGEGPTFCLSDDTRILTNNGLKYRSELDIEKDLIATFNRKTGALEYQKASRKYEYDWDSINGNSPPLKRFITNKIDMLVTPNHRMLYAPRKCSDGLDGYGDWSVVEAGSIKDRGRFRACVDDWIGTTEEKESYFGISKHDFLKIVGWYISEGSRHKDSKRNNKIYSVDIAQSPTANPQVYAKIKEVLTRNAICKIYPSTKNSFAISNVDNRELVSYLVENCGQLSGTKRIPVDLKNMSKESIRIILSALVEGDGSHRLATKKTPTNKQYFTYTTVSTSLRDDVAELVLKLGFSPKLKKEDRRGKQTIYRVYWSDSKNGKFPTLASRKTTSKKQVCKKVIEDFDYVGKVWCVDVPNHFIITERNGIFGVHGNSNAAVGIEAMIQRLETFRGEIAHWIENFIYLPEAIRQGFVEVNEETGEQEYVYPKIKWTPMNLRDQQQSRQFIMQLYEKGLISAQTVLEAFELDPDKEIERKRYDALQMMALGQQQGGAGGGGGGMGGGFGGGGGGLPDLGGGGGGLPDLGGGGAPDMGGGAPIEAGGAPDMGGGAGGAPISTASSNNNIERFAQADPSQYGGKVLKEKTRQKLDKQKQKMYDSKGEQTIVKDNIRDEKGRIIFTSIERKLIPQLMEYQKNGLIRYHIVPQFRVGYGSQEYPIDFAIPNLKIGIEADGEIFHSSEKQVQSDKERDSKLAQQGWTILRFTDKEIEKQMERVMSTILKTIMQKEVQIKKQAEDSGIEVPQENK